MMVLLVLMVVCSRLVEMMIFFEVGVCEVVFVVGVVCDLVVVVVEVLFGMLFVGVLFGVVVVVVVVCGVGKNIDWWLFVCC